MSTSQPNQQPSTNKTNKQQPGKPKSKHQAARNQAAESTTAKHAKNHQTTSNQANNPAAVITIDDNSPDPESWFQIQDHDDSPFTLYQDAGNHILRKTTWLCDSEIHAGQVLLKIKFPCVDGLHNPAFVGELGTLEISEFVQIINTGNRWVCLSTVSCRPGTIKG